MNIMYNIYRPKIRGIKSIWYATMPKTAEMGENMNHLSPFSSSLHILILWIFKKDTLTNIQWSMRYKEHVEEPVGHSEATPG
jgi:hypothetical protein